MSIKTIVDKFMSIHDVSDEDVFSKENMETGLSIRNELKADTEVAQKLLTSQISEGQLVKLCLAAQRIATAELAASGKFQMMIADASGELQSYTQTVILSVIGALIQDEIL